MNVHLLNRLTDQAQHFAEHRMWLHASQIYYRILNEHPDRVDVALKLAAVYAEMGNLNAAEQTLLTALGKDQYNADIIYALGTIFFQASDDDRARFYFEKLIPQRLPQVHFMLGKVHERKREPIPAERQYRLALELDPSYTDAASTLAGMLIEIDEASRAVPLLEEALKKSPNEWRLRFLLGAAYSLSARWEEAVMTFNVVLESQPDDVNALYGKAQAMA
jgi:tetratricopeptide (TPR) repeat protein